MTELAKEQMALESALAMGGLGYKIVPIPPGEKFPKGLPKWQERATNDELQIHEWWGGDTQKGIGWAMGRQPNGQNLVAIDIDEGEGKNGLDWFQSWGDENCTDDEWQIVASTVASETGGGGSHLIFALPDDVEVTNGVFGPDVDIRGEGGFIVIPPTIHPNGEPYLWVNPPSQFPILMAPEPLLAHLRRQDTPEPPPRAPRATQPVSEELSPADWVRDNLSIADLLSQSGWTYMETKGEDHYWCRPGKSPRDGHSAILHGDSPLVIWSTSAPIAFWRAGTDNRDGSRTLSPFEVYAAVECGGDTRAAGRRVRKTLMPRDVSRETSILDTIPVRSAAAAVVVDRGGDGDAEKHDRDTDEHEGVSHSLNLPDEFWEARPELEHIRQAAQNRMVSPDALLVCVLSRVAAMVPRTLKIPPMVGSVGTFDFLGCVVASSSGGKSVANGVAAELLPGTPRVVKFDASPGSGEGMIAAFMGYEKGDNGKNIGKPSWKFGDFKSIHFTVDEGTALMAQADRSGTTIVQTLCTAWSGKALGQLNASIDTRREIPGGKVRVSAVINMQTGAAHLLMAPNVIGLPQRVLFSWAHAKGQPEVEPEWPGELYWPPLKDVGETWLEYHPDIVAGVKDLRRAVLNETTHLDDLDGHLMFGRVKVAGLLTLLFGGDEVGLDEWALAGQMLDVSVAVRERVSFEGQRQAMSASHARGVAAGHADFVRDSVKEQRLIEALRERIIKRVADAGPDGAARGKLRKSMSKDDTRHRFDAAWEMAAGGKEPAIELRGKRWFPA